MLRPDVGEGDVERAREDRGILVAGDACRARDRGTRPRLLLPFLEDSGVRGNCFRVRNGSFDEADIDADEPTTGAMGAGCCFAPDLGAGLVARCVVAATDEDGKLEFVARARVGVAPLALSFHTPRIATTAPSSSTKIFPLNPKRRCNGGLPCVGNGGGALAFALVFASGGFVVRR